MLTKYLLQFVFFSLAAVFCLHSSEFTYIGLIEYQIKNPDYVCGLFTALYILLVASVMKFKSVDRYIAFMKGTYRKWILSKEFSLTIHTIIFSVIFILANWGVSSLRSIDMCTNENVIHVVQELFLFTMRFLMLGEILLFLSIICKGTTIAYTVTFGLSLGLDSRAPYMGSIGAILPQYHMSLENYLMSALYFASLISIIFYMNCDIYFQKDVF